MPAPMRWPASPTGPQSRSSPGGRAGPTAPATAFGRRATASKAASRVPAYEHTRLSPFEPPRAATGSAPLRATEYGDCGRGFGAGADGRRWDRGKWDQGGADP